MNGQTEIKTDKRVCTGIAYVSPAADLWSTVSCSPGPTLKALQGQYMLL